MIEVKVSKVLSSALSQTHALILEAREEHEEEWGRHLPVFTTYEGAVAVISELPGSTTKGFMTGVLCELVDTVGIEIKMSVVADCVGGVFKAKLVTALGDETLEVGCSVAEAVAVALRAKAPIFVEEGVFDKAGVVSKECDGEEVERTPQDVY